MVHVGTFGIDLRIVRIDDLAVFARREPETERLDPLLDGRRPAQKQRFCNPLVNDHLCRAQHALVLAFRQQERLTASLCHGEYRLHCVTGLVDEAAQLLAMASMSVIGRFATPLSAAALATAGATTSMRRGSSGFGIR